MRKLSDDQYISARPTAATLPLNELGSLGRTMGWPQENSVVFAQRDPRSAQGSDVPSAVLTQAEAAAKRREEVGSGSEDSATQAGALLKRLALPRWRHVSQR